MAHSGLFGDDAAFETMFYIANDRRKFVQRRAFLFVATLTYALFGLLDPLTGGDSTEILVDIRIVTVIVMSAIWAIFTTSTDYRVRELCVCGYALTVTFSILLMIVCADKPAADYYPFAIGMIQVFGGCLAVPQFRTMAIVCIVSYLGFWGTVGLGQTSVISLQSNAFMLTVTTFSLIVGAYAREALERDQMRKENLLAAARDEAILLGEEAVRANKTKNHMLANLSHELRTPMNAIIGFSEAMKMELYGPIQQPKYLEYITDIHRSGGILLANINDLLDIARIEAGKMGWEETVFPVARAMDTAVKASRATLRDQTIRIVWHDASNGACVTADFDRLCQAIINVLNNAGKFSSPQSLIQLTFERHANGWAIRVTDEGCGIPKEDLHRIREPFAQVGPGDYSATKGGLGLGLAITGEIIRRLDGEFTIESELDRGTTVTFVLPESRVTTMTRRLRA